MSTADLTYAFEPASGSMRSVVLAGSIGTVIEWYDFLIYATSAALVFNKLFFPTADPNVGTLAALGAYAVGFFARPLGGVLFCRPMRESVSARRSSSCLCACCRGSGSAANGAAPRSSCSNTRHRARAAFTEAWSRSASRSASSCRPSFSAWSRSSRKRSSCPGGGAFPFCSARCSSWLARLSARASARRRCSARCKPAAP